MTDIKQIYTSHQSLVGTVTPSVIRTVPFSLGGYAPSGKWYSPYNFGCYSSNQRLALACIFVYYNTFTSLILYGFKGGGGGNGFIFIVDSGGDLVFSPVPIF